MSGVNCSRRNFISVAGRERLKRECLRESGHAFEQDVAVGDEADEQAVHEIFLADQYAADFLAQRRDSKPSSGARLRLWPEYVHCIRLDAAEPL